MEDWDKILGDEELDEAVKNIESRGIKVIVVENKEEALEKLKSLIPKEASIANGSSTTLNEIGFVSYLQEGDHGWKNLHKEVLEEKDPARQAELRRKMVTADYFLGSVNAISKNGELVACDNSGSRVGAYHFAAKNLLLVAGCQKIADNLEGAMRRIKEYVFPLENERAKKAYGTGSNMSKWIIIEKEIIPHRITLILVKEKLGF